MNEIWINEIFIENYKGIEKLNIKFNKGINLLVGDNGVGKTSILTAISKGLYGLFTNIKGVKAKGILDDEIMTTYSIVGDASQSKTVHYPTVIGMKISFIDQIYSYERCRKQNSSTTSTSNKDISKKLSEISNVSNSYLPVFCFLEDSRRVLDDNKPLNIISKTREETYNECLDGAVRTKDFYPWCLNMELSAFQEQRRINEYEIFKKLVSNFMKELDEDEGGEIYYAVKEKALMYKCAGKIRRISKLSAGYQSALQIAMNIAYQISSLNPFIEEDNLSNAAGIVMIDELDLHLHPKWQWNILNAIEKTFPNIQFIISTHSPIIISSCKNENIIYIQDQNVRYLPNAFGFSVEEVLNLRQGSKGKNKVISSAREEFDEFMDKDDFISAQEIINELMDYSNKIGIPLNDVTNMQNELDDAKWIEEN